MTDWRMPADPSVVIEDHDILGEFSTDDGRSARWVDFTLVGSEAGYFLYGVGKSRIGEEIDRPWGKWFPEAFLVVRALLQAPPPDKYGRVRTSTVDAAREMLAAAALEDVGIADALARWRG